MVPVGAVYLSYPTELGTLYSHKELQDIYAVCRKYGIYLFVDGARLGYGLMSAEGMSMKELADSCDVFYIGGTKVGALFGEAVVFRNRKICPKFFTIMKRHGALLAKGRILGIQFDCLFTDGLYYTISLHALKMAARLQEIFLEKGYEEYYASPTVWAKVHNIKQMAQTLLFLEEHGLRDYDELSEKVGFSFWEKLDDGRIVVRLAASWATREEDVEALKEIL